MYNIKLTYRFFYFYFLHCNKSTRGTFQLKIGLHLNIVLEKKALGVKIHCNVTDTVFPTTTKHQIK